MEEKMFLVRIILLLVLIIQVVGFSRVPLEFTNSTWYSNVHGEIQFTSTKVYNWRVDGIGISNVTWFIVDDTRLNNVGGYIIFRSSGNYTINGTSYFVYMCANLYKIQDHLYTYYSLHDVESRFGNERVLLLQSPCIEHFQNVCDLKLVPDPDDTHLLVRKGSHRFRVCPDHLSGLLGFTVQSTYSTDLCVGLTNRMDGCQDNTRVVVNSNCGYPLLFSDSLNLNQSKCLSSGSIGNLRGTALRQDFWENGPSRFVFGKVDPLLSCNESNGSLSCLTEQASGNDGVIYLLNLDDVVDDVTTFRFSCVVISGDGTIMSIVPQRCLSDHTSSSFPTSTTLGQRLFIKTRAVCDTRVTSVYDETQSLWIKIGIPVGVVVLFLIILAIVMIVLCMRIRRRQMAAHTHKAYEVKNGKYPPKTQIVYIQKVPRHLMKDADDDQNKNELNNLTNDQTTQF